MYLLGGAQLNKTIQNNIQTTNINPIIGLEGIISQKYLINCNISNTSIYINMGVKLFQLK